MLRNKYIAIAVFIILALVIAYNFELLKPKGKKIESPSLRKSEIASINKYSTEKIPDRIFEKEDKTRWKRDPFNLNEKLQIVLEEKEEKLEKPELDIRLMGIIKRNGRSHVLLNGKVYRVKDKFGDAVIKEIKRHSIVLLIDNKAKEISFEDYIVLKEKTK